MNGPRGSSSLRSAFSYCVQQVRNYDYHHYLCLLELPPQMRKAAFALRAFNVETARAMDVASDPKIGLMRLLWWQEAIDKLYTKKTVNHPAAQALSWAISEHSISKPWLKRSVEARIQEAIDKLYTKKTVNHPAAQALSWAISEHSISKPWLKRSVEARIRDAQREADDIPESVEELEKYAEDTVSTLLYNTLQAGGISSTAADHAASHIGKASGLVLLLKSLPYHCTRNRHHNYIPVELAEKHGLLVKQGGMSEILLDNDSREGLCNVVFEIASVANVHLLKARELAGKVPAEAKPVLLHSVPVQVLLDSLSKVHFDVFDPRMQRGVLGVPPLWFQVRLKWYSWRSTF